MPESSRLVLGATTVALVGLASAGTGLIVSHGARSLDPSGPPAGLPAAPTATPAAGPLVVARPPGTFVVPTRLDRPEPSPAGVVLASAPLAPVPGAAVPRVSAAPSASAVPASEPAAQPTTVTSFAVTGSTPTPSPTPVTTTGAGHRHPKRASHPKHPHPTQPPHPEPGRHHDSG